MNITVANSTLRVSRGYAYSATLSALDKAGYIPDGVTQARYALYWRKPGSALVTADVTISANEMTVALPANYTDIAATTAYLDCMWLVSGVPVLFATHVLQFVDIPAASGTPAAASTQYILMGRSGLAQLGDMAQFFKCPAGGGTLTSIALSAQIAPTGDDLTVALYKDGVATGDTWTLADGERALSSTIAVELSGSSIYQLHVTQIGSAYPGEDIYAVFGFLPN